MPRYVAQMDLELREAKDEGAVLREEIEARVREVLKERLAELDVRRAREVRELDPVSESSSRDARGTWKPDSPPQTKEQRDQMAQGGQEQVAQMERRLELSQEARLAASRSRPRPNPWPGSKFDSNGPSTNACEKTRNGSEKYVELLARLKTEVDQGLAHTITSAEFDRAVTDRVSRSLETARISDPEIDGGTRQ